MAQYLITLALQSWWPEDLSSVPSTHTQKLGIKAHTWSSIIKDGAESTKSLDCLNQIVYSSKQQVYSSLRTPVIREEGKQW